MTITEFLEDRITEDEDTAGSGWSRLGDSRWETNNYGQCHLTPAAVLAECAAKRAIIKVAGDIHDRITGEWGGGERWSDDGWQAGNEGTEIVCALASVYRDHPDYQKEWSL